MSRSNVVVFAFSIALISCWVIIASPSNAKVLLQSATPTPTNMPLPSDAIVLNMLGRWNMITSINDWDHLTTNDPRETPPPLATFEGQQWYIPATPAPNRNELSRMYSHQPGTIYSDHMDSIDPTRESPLYATEAVIGYPYQSTNAPVGSCPLKRYLLNDGTRFDHMTGGCNENPAGYIEEGPLGYGYPRFAAGEIISYFEPGNVGVTFGLNKAAGGAVWTLTWNGKQVVNDYDYGRQISIAVNSGLPETDNPTESGDVYGYPSGYEGHQNDPWAHGSVLIGEPTSLVNGGFKTKTYPLLWNSNVFLDDGLGIQLFGQVQSKRKSLFDRAIPMQNASDG